MSTGKQFVRLVSALTFLALGATGAFAGEKHEQAHDHGRRQHDSHVHGIAALNLVLEGREVYVEIDSPAANIVGFEHAPSSDADHATLDKAVATLKDGARLFRFNDAAGCRMETVNVSYALLDEEQDDHASEHSSDHVHEKKGKHDDEEHEGDGHSDIEAVYHFVCSAPRKLTEVNVELFDAFPVMEKLELQYVIEARQGATELTAGNHVVKF
jgi:hypothetical protein